MSAVSGWSLEDAIASGQGEERPFRCTEHDDTMASASVNVVKMVWYCHACQARGAVDAKKAPRLEDLQAMVEPEKAVRTYPLTWLDLFDHAGEQYWDTRFPRWLSWYLQMGQDPFTGDATFAVHTANGTLAGVGRRHVAPDGGKRYMYPKRWSAASSMFGAKGRIFPAPVLTLVEGAADAAAVWETGAPALAVYGSGLHAPQLEMLVKFAPRLILLGFDMDDAGELAVSRAFKQCKAIAPLRRVYWKAKDPGESGVAARSAALQKAVTASDYGAGKTSTFTEWATNVYAMQDAHAAFIKEYE